jgi:hypothetical protein
VENIARAVPDALDSLGMAWRLAFGSDQRLVRTTTLGSVAELSEPCVGRAEFQSRASASADILKQLAVGDSLLPPGTRLDPSQTFDRIEAVLKDKIDPDSAAQARHASPIFEPSTEFGWPSSTRMLRSNCQPG